MKLDVVRAGELYRAQGALDLALRLGGNTTVPSPNPNRPTSASKKQSPKKKSPTVPKKSGGSIPAGAPVGAQAEVASKPKKLKGPSQKRGAPTVAKAVGSFASRTAFNRAFRAFVSNEKLEAPEGSATSLYRIAHASGLPPDGDAIRERALLRKASEQEFLDFLAEDPGQLERILASSRPSEEMDI